jgi:two-component system sensor histidine kinase/response regulator
MDKKNIDVENGEILIVEDSPTQAAQLRHILERHGFHVSTAANGREALAVIARGKPSLVISDVIMPEMDGFELCRAIKANEETREIPVILLTSLSDAHDVIKGLACRADNFITKPYDEDYLILRIRRMQETHGQSRSGDNPVTMDVPFAGQIFSINSDGRQILDFLLSTYETAIQKNRELLRARDELNEVNEQLKIANREKDAFNYTVSHDLRNHLNVVGSYCQVIREVCGDGLDAQCREYLQDAYNAVLRMDRLIGTFLDFSRLTNSELRRDTVDLSELAIEIASDLKVGVRGRSVDFRIKAGIIAYADPSLMRVVFENLLGNACKYTGKQEEAVIEFGKTEQEGGNVYFVRDNGPGFDMADAEKLFTPFHRLPGAAEFKGNGIGLATVERIIKRHGGGVWAEGEPGRGATFYFTLRREES